ncbi:MAG: EAL domain-containing protein [Lachnospiraceae bacterium]|nr:EAL domain-containing protein [Lachnospiraceae bacterium]
MCCLIYILLRGRQRREHNRFFLMILLNVMISALSCCINTFLTYHAGDSVFLRGLQQFAAFVYFFAHAALAPMFYVYVIYVTGSIYRHRRKKSRFGLLMLPYFVMALLVLLNFSTHWLYEITPEHVYHRNNGMYMIYIGSALYFGMAIVEMIRYRHAADEKHRKGLFYLMGITLPGILIQMINPRLVVEIFAESVALLCVMLFMEDDDELLDTATELYNRNALRQELHILLHMKQEFSLIVIHILHPETLQRHTGINSEDELMGQIGAYLCGFQNVCEIYRVSNNCFALLGFQHTASVSGETAEQICRRFEDSWECEGVVLHLQAQIMQADYPADINGMDEVFRMLDTAGEAELTGAVLRGEKLSYLSRSAEISKALRRGFEEHFYEVYYQPIYALENMSIHAAEALLRLHDDKLGDIPPSEFIPIAENDGMIDEIGAFVLEEACMFLGSGLPEQMGIEYISVNLSLVQCMRSGFADLAKELTQRYDIAPSLISFEIKESAAVEDIDVLLHVIRELREYGFRFSMDRFGTGFSDMQSLYTLNFDVIKIDRSVLNRAESRVGRIILENCVRMIREMKRRILVEGVETKEQIDLLKKLDVDYVQGYYSSKPMTKNELLGILRVTELARMEERRANAASEAKSGFLANMSHEIRTPINAVLGMNEMIQRECDEPQIMAYAKEIETAGRNLLSLVNNILDYSKIEAGEMEIVEAEYDLKNALGDVIRSMYKKTRTKHLTFRVFISEELPARLYGDEFRLKQILTNLLNNAVKYTKEGGVRLTVEGERYSEDELLLQISVEDTGCGIREEDQSKLYEMFQRLDMERNRTIEGSGLGLAISYQLLQMMQGEISVDSMYGVGSTFRVQLIQKIATQMRIRPFRAEELKAIYNGWRGAGDFQAPDAKILIIDDTPLNHTVMKQLLKSSHVQIDTALSGSEGLRLAQERYYDMIFLDKKMPGMDGTETLKALRSNREAASHRSPVISMTAVSYAGIADAEQKLGFNDYLEKPVDSGKLAELLRKYLPESKVFLN